MLHSAMFACIGVFIRHGLSACFHSRGWKEAMVINSIALGSLADSDFDSSPTLKLFDAANGDHLMFGFLIEIPYNQS